MEHQHEKGQWASDFGFLMAAIGSAVGLGNLWAFPYKMGRFGGFAFLLIYLVLVAVVGIIIMLAELSLGRKSGKGVVEAYESISRKYAFVGWFGWIAPLLIMSFYSMLGGYCIKYAVANLGDMFHAGWGVGGAESGDYFGTFVTNQPQTVIYTLIFVFITVLIVKFGVSSGIEKFSKVSMPILFILLVIAIIRSVTMPGAVAGLEFVFKPDFTVFKGTSWINIFGFACSQMFFSLSLSMGIMIAYGSYMKKNDNLQRTALLIPVADTIIAIMAAMAIMPAVFSAGLEPAQGPGLLFVTLQTVFQAMGAFGPLFGFLFYVLVFIAAMTSSISLLESVCAVLMDRRIKKGKDAGRSRIVLLTGLFVAAEASFVALDGLGNNGFPQIFRQGCWLDSFDLVSEGVLMPLGAMIMAIIFGWLKPGYTDDEISLDQGGFKMRKYFHFCVKYVVPPFMVLVLLGQLDIFFKLGWFS